jgi:hypothetical protein
VRLENVCDWRFWRWWRGGDDGEGEGGSCMVKAVGDPIASVDCEGVGRR